MPFVFCCAGSASAAGCDGPLAGWYALPQRPPVVYAVSAVPHLFPHIRVAPDRPGERRFALNPSGRTAAIAQGILDQAARVRGPRSAAIVDRVAAADPLDVAVVSTHMRPALQAEIARALKEDVGLCDVPRIALVTSHRMFNAPDADFTNAMDAFVLSNDGEIPHLLAKRVYLIGGFAGACLSRTLYQLLHHAGDLGLPEIEVHVRAAWTYDIGKPSYRAMLSRGALSEADARAFMELLAPDQFLIPGTFSRPSSGGPMRMRLEDVDISRGHPSPRTHAKMNLVIE